MICWEDGNGAALRSTTRPAFERPRLSLIWGAERLLAMNIFACGRYRQCGTLEGIAFEDLGPQPLKNIPDPVRLWRIAPPSTGEPEADDGSGGAVADLALPAATGLGAAVQRGLERILATPAPLVALVIVLVGMALIGVSFVIGIGTVAYPLRVGGVSHLKEVGFLAALNWSIPLVVIYPAIAAIALFGYRDIGEILQELARRRMLVDERFEPAPCGACSARCSTRQRRARASATSTVR